MPSLSAGLKLSARSYAQAGEDMLLRHAFVELGVRRPSYLEIGAHHPTWLSNTFFFYRRRSRGVLVEADPAHIRRLRMRRPRDVVLNVAVAGHDGHRTLHQFRGGFLDLGRINTLSDLSAAELEREGWKHVADITVPVISPTTLLERHCRQTPDFVSLDIEGVDVEVLEAWDFERFRPRLFVIETLTFTADGSSSVKRPEIPTLMERVGYGIYGDTHINTVFLDAALR